MRSTITLVFLCALLAGCSTAKLSVPKTTFSSFDSPEDGPSSRIYSKDDINIKGALLKEFLAIYQDASGRTVIYPTTLGGLTLSVRNQTPVTRIQALQLFDTVLAQNGIAMILSGDNAVKAVPIAMAAQEAGPIIDLPADQLPDSGSYMVRIVRFKRTKPSEVVPMVQPFARVPNGIIPMEKEQILVLRDFSANIRQMLRVIDAIEKGAGR